MDSIKCEVVLGDVSPPVLPSIRTKEQLKYALSVLQAGEGLFWRYHMHANTKARHTIWFWDGKLGWHLRSDTPEDFTVYDWSCFSVLKMDMDYERIPNPLSKK